MYIFFELALILSCVSMFFIPRRYKPAILLTALTCLTLVKIPGIPFGACTYIVSICFFLSEIQSLSRHIESLKDTIIGRLLLLVIVSTTIAYFASPHFAGSATGAIQLFLRDLVVKYFPIAYSFVCLYEEDDVEPMLDFTFYAIIVLTLFGVFNLIVHHSYLVDELASIRKDTTDTDLLGGYFEKAERFRVQAMFFNPFDYGYICIILLFIHIWGYLKGFESKPRFYIVIACALFGILFCNCRTVMLSGMIGVLTFILIYKEQAGRIRYTLFIILGLFLLYALVPPVQQFIDFSLSAFDKNARVSGSTLDMRMIQFARVLYYWDGHEWLGRGVDFFEIDLGWSEGKEAAVDKDLYGLEGVVFNLLLERGLVGLIAYFVFYLTLCYHIYKLRHLDQITAALGFSTLLSYIAFANMTGELLSVCPTLLVTGMVISLLYMKEELGADDEIEDEIQNEEDFGVIEIE